MGLTFEIQERAKKDYTGSKVYLFVKVDAIDSSYPGGMVDDSSGRIRITLGIRSTFGTRNLVNYDHPQNLMWTVH